MENLEEKEMLYYEPFRHEERHDNFHPERNFEGGKEWLELFTEIKLKIILNTE